MFNTVVIYCEVLNTNDRDDDNNDTFKLVFCLTVISLLFSPRVVGENELSLCSLELFRGYVVPDLQGINAGFDFAAFKLAVQ